VVLDTPPLEDERVADRAVIVHGTARRGIHKTAADSGKEYPDPGKSMDSVELSETTVLPEIFTTRFFIFIIDFNWYSC
jgi:hypothetical protein